MPKPAKRLPVITKRTVLSRHAARLCRHPVELVVEQCEVTCPVRALAPPTLRIIGRFPEVSVSASGRDTAPVVRGNTIAFGSTKVEFLKGCESIAVNGRTYELGRLGEGFCYEFADGDPVSVYRDRPRDRTEIEPART
jgi:hypothetical protein